MWLLLITSLCKVWDFSSDASKLNSWNLSDRWAVAFQMASLNILHGRL